VSGVLDGLWTQAIDIWTDGGWAMIALAVTAMVIFSLGCSVWLRLRDTGFQSLPEETWRQWIEYPALRRGHLGRIMDAVTGCRTIKDSELAFEDLRTSEIRPFERDLRLMRICVTAAPLLGLLGTVTGMLSTFGALASGGGGDETMSMVSAGISEALITTETGLVVALAGLFFQYQLTRTQQKYAAFLAHLETVWNQRIHRSQVLVHAAA
jgi:biopolymer transport protein ExbB